ncbi:MAG: hypothetical protein LBH62_04610 [Nitrososphaerota archaeon]|uniref:hypothetical protein n=1 Tax=Candidatus Bathycorpusculum sp. TaxID=2994959 RepID=UPI00281D97BE|nr:hypothetical protein [Candidatus Termiticorpusculum sp.]MCL2257915.1 hypothetical protein [Candidatus Termiticorpusculum sp.]MCL2291940.1 hypothetical protein [Candidatus Termiticorpusculum sp.]MDR0460703.1 hypothetical protein [Nitrososphaerota archaeon]
MPKSKPKAQSKVKSQIKTKQKTPLSTPGITTKKWYWVMLTVVMVAVFSVVGYISNLDLIEIAVLMFVIAILIGLIGYVRITPSNLPATKRATFLFVGASVIGFGIWAAIMLVAINTELIASIFSNPFFVIPSFIIFLIVGAFIGELLGKNRRVQALLFKTESNPKS